MRGYMKANTDGGKFWFVLSQVLLGPSIWRRARPIMWRRKALTRLGPRARAHRSDYLILRARTAPSRLAPCEWTRSRPYTVRGRPRASDWRARGPERAAWG